MHESDHKVSRRDFLAASAAVPTYSLFVRMDDPVEIPERATTRQVQTTPPQAPEFRFEGEPHMTLVDLECDLLVAGGGPSGVLAALAAARNGARVILVQDRSRLGGNSSSEVKMHIVGANNHRGRPGWREGGILEELRLDDAVNNPQRSWELWDLLLYDKVISEPNARLLVDTTVYAAEVSEGAIRRVMARCDKTETLYRITAGYFADCTGDARLAMESGATVHWGHESREAFGEPLAWEKPSRETLGSSILFTGRDYGRPMPYTPPKWARKIEERHLYRRNIGSESWEYGYWWIEWGGHLDTIKENDRIRHELLAIVTGVWDYIKNSGRFPGSETWAMDWVGMMPGKRESRRIEGDHILTQQDLMGLNGDFEDAVALGGWPFDEHPPGGFDDSDQPPFVSIRMAEVYNIPLRSLYSKDLSNLFMAGRNASCTHVAFTSTRVMATCAVMDQAVGTAAALCARHGLTPRQLYQDRTRLSELQQTLLRDDQTIKHRRNSDPKDLARQAKVSSSGVRDGSRAESVIDGFVRDMEETHEHRWVAPLAADGAWIELAWPTAQSIRQVQIAFDTGFHRELTLTSADNHNQHMIRGAQPETARDYTVSVRTAGGRWVEVAQVTGNHQRLRRHDFQPVAAEAVRVHVRATHGSPEARIYEVRAYG
jgi:hypothetical protein